MSEQNNQIKKFDIGQMLKFTFFSISAGLIQIGSFALLENFTAFSYWPCYLISLVLSVVWNFTFNRRYTFKSVENIPKAMSLVFLYYLVFTPITTILGDYFTKTLSVNEYIVLGVTMVLNFVTEFLYQRFVVYKKTINTNDLSKKNSKK